MPQVHIVSAVYDDDYDTIYTLKAFLNKEKAEKFAEENTGEFERRDPEGRHMEKVKCFVKSIELDEDDW